MKKLLFFLFAFFASTTISRADTIVSGICGDSLTWSINKTDSTLIITGSGEMYNWARKISDDVWSTEKTPWSEYSTWIAYISLPAGLTTIGNRAFYDCSNLRCVTIPDSVISIGYCAFTNCYGLTSVIIGNKVTSIGASAFYGCTSLTSVILPNSVTTIEYFAFFDCSNLTSMTIGNSVTSIGESAFYGCTSLTSVVLPNSVTSIGNSAFNECGLTAPLYNVHVFAFLPSSYSGAYTIPEGIESIAGGAFRDCKNLTSVIIPNSVTSIGSSAFWNCTNLTSATIPNSVTNIGLFAFTNSGLTAPLYNAHVFAFLPSSYSGSYAIPDGIESIAGGAFTNCYGLTSIIIPSSVTCIGENAFAGCIGLTSVKIPNSVTNIEEYAFGYCRGLTSIELPNSVTSIKKQTFYKCTGLTSITIPNSVRYIGFIAFKECTSLASVIIGDSITYIDFDAFSDCSSLTTVSISAITPPSIQNSTFHNCVNLDSIYVPCESYDQYRTYWYWTLFSQQITFKGERFNVNISVTDSLMGIVSAPAAACDNSIIQISATPYAGFRFKQWSDSVTDNPRSIFVESDIALTAEFEEIEYILTLKTNDSIMGRVYGSGAYTLNTQVNCYAIPNDGYKFVSWNDGVKDNPYIITISGDTTLTAMFQPLSEGISDTKGQESSPRKVLENGQLFILLPDGQRFNVLGEKQ